MKINIQTIIAIFFSSTTTLYPMTLDTIGNNGLYHIIEQMDKLKTLSTLSQCTKNINSETKDMFPQKFMQNLSYKDCTRIFISTLNCSDEISKTKKLIALKNFEPSIYSDLAKELFSSTDNINILKFSLNQLKNHPREMENLYYNAIRHLANPIFLELLLEQSVNFPTELGHKTLINAINSDCNAVKKLCGIEQILTLILSHKTTTENVTLHINTFLASDGQNKPCMSCDNDTLDEKKACKEKRNAIYRKAAKSVLRQLIYKNYDQIL